MYQPPILDCGTASIADIRTIVGVVEDECINRHGCKVVILMGDFQTFKNLVRFKLQHPETTRWLCPVPGEWHWWVHSLMAIHKSWFPVLFENINDVGDLCYISVNEVWSNVEKLNPYKFFHNTFICGAMQYLNEILPPFLIKNPNILMDMCAENGGTVRRF